MQATLTTKAGERTREYCDNCGIALDAQGGCGICKPGKTAPGKMTADEINHSFGIHVDSERLTDGSRVWNVLTSEAEINCLSERHARALAFAIAVEIRNATAL